MSIGVIKKTFLPVVCNTYTISDWDYLHKTMCLCYITIESFKLFGRLVPFLKGSKFLIPFNITTDSPSRKFTQRGVKMLPSKMSCTLKSDPVSKKQKAENFVESKKKKLKSDESSDNENVSSTNKKKGFLTSDRNIGDRNKRKMERPNYFVAVKVSDPEIHKSVSDIQKYILSQDNRYENCMIAVPTLHITLMVMCIDDLETHERALKALGNVQQEYTATMSKKPLNLEFEGIGNFRNKVVFAKIKENEAYRRLHNLYECVHKHFTNVNIFSTDRRTTFTPHLTIAKIDFSKPSQRHLRIIDPVLYEAFTDHYVGCQTISGIQLLKMSGPKDLTGYYKGNELLFGTR